MQLMCWCCWFVADAPMLLMCWCCWCNVAANVMLLLMRCCCWCIDAANVLMCWCIDAFDALLIRWCCWCADAADVLLLLMLLNQNQNQVVDLSIAFCSRLTCFFMCASCINLSKQKYIHNNQKSEWKKQWLSSYWSAFLDIAFKVVAKCLFENISNVCVIWKECN